MSNVRKLISQNFKILGCLIRAVFLHPPFPVRNSHCQNGIHFWMFLVMFIAIFPVNSLGSDMKCCSLQSSVFPNHSSVVFFCLFNTTVLLYFKMNIVCTDIGWGVRTCFIQKAFCLHQGPQSWFLPWFKIWIYAQNILLGSYWIK